MAETGYRGRRAVSIENDHVRLTVLVEGGHIAEFRDKRTDINPLWTPPWESIEPSTYDPARHSEYGHDAESKLLSGIMGHNLCMDIFGPPSPEEAAAGLTVHGEASVVPYEITSDSDSLTQRTSLQHAQLRFERRIRLDGAFLEIDETVENESITDRPIAWTQHVTLGPPFLDPRATQFRIPIAQTEVLEAGVYSANLLDLSRETAHFLAWSPGSGTVLVYAWHRADFPWLGIWEENLGRQQAPWNGRTVTRGLEFGVSPMPETRRKMIERGSLFGVPAFRWIPARTAVQVRYCAAIGYASGMPEALGILAAAEIRLGA
jgi:hypothetical protein